MKKSSNKYPSISVVTPTLNAERVLEKELKSIREQDYPQDKIEIIIADGGSTDKTLAIAKMYKASIYPNPLKTGEAGKAVGVKKAKGELIALIDSDNILPQKDWFKRMVKPLVEHVEVIGSEPWSFTYRKDSGFIERYSALIGANDPIVLWYKTYDRLNTVSGKWTESNVFQKDFGNWIEVTLKKERDVPTIGANGTIFRSDFLQNAEIGDYLFDIDVLLSEVQKKGEVKFAKVKTSIIHTYCESDIAKFSRKQKRRVLDYFFYKSKGLRNTEWESKGSQLLILKFALDTILLIPTLSYSIIGFSKKPDFAWFFHPIACLITLFQYVIGTISFKVNKLGQSRDDWKQ